jgi:ribosomal-protein-alanine N-acetyltransferase
LADYAIWCRSHDLSGPKINKFDRDPWPVEKRSRSLFNRNVRRHRREAKNDRVYVWNIFLKSTGEMIGWIDLWVIQREIYQMANLGYFLINTYRGRGYALEAVPKIICAAFKDLKLHRLEAAIDVDNRASIAFAKKVGLHREGVKKNYWPQHGRWDDQIVYVATPELFKPRRS